MKKILIAVMLSLAGAGYVYLQTTAPTPRLAGFLPGGALLYLEAPDFGSLLRAWDSSKVKTDWLASANYAAFSRSNLFLKLQEVYAQYGAAAGFDPGLKSVIEIAGTDSALALYEIRDVEFLYLSRVPESVLTKTALWAARDKFQQRQAGGTSFYLRTDPTSKRTVAFAFAKGYLIVGTRDDLVAQSLDLLAGRSTPSVATDRWYRAATEAAAAPGELRLTLNLESLVRSVYFRSYWVQRNASVVKQYWSGVADLRRSGEGFIEDRYFLRAPDSAAPPRVDVAGLIALVPKEAGMYKGFGVPSGADAADLVIEKVIGRLPQSGGMDWRYAPWAASMDARAGSEAELETRIDEQPLAADPGKTGAVTALRELLGDTKASVLVVQTTAAAGGPFIRTPSVVVIEGGRDWDRRAAQLAVSTAAASLWTTAHLGAGWTNGRAGNHPVDRLDGLANVVLSVQGRRLFLANDPDLLGRTLDRVAEPVPSRPMTYAAGFRHARERANYRRMMEALDFNAPGSQAPFGGADWRNGAAPIFSGNLASVSAALADIAEIDITQEDGGSAVVQRVVYRISR